MKLAIANVHMKVAENVTVLLIAVVSATPRREREMCCVRV